jgi:DnaK suppressor protein
LIYNEILEALERIDNGEYGICEECGMDIGARRLDVYPTSKMCIACQEEFERGQRAKNLVKSAKNKDEDQSE